MQPKQIKRVQVNSLKKWNFYTSHVATPEKLSELKNRISDIGFNDVLKVAKDGLTVLGGNNRLDAITQLGFTEVDVLLTGAEALEDMIKIALSDNQEFAEYDLPALRLQLQQAPGLNLTGYTLNIGCAAPLSEVLNVTEDSDVEDDFDVETAIPEAPESKPGEIYQLGRHMLMCGDSTKSDDLDRLLGDDKADFVFTDPPYMVDYHSAAESAKLDGNNGAIFNDNLSDDDAQKFYTAVLENLYSHTTDHCPIYWWYAIRNQHINQAAFAAAGWYFSQSIMWVKEHMVLARAQDFHRLYEPCMFGWKKGKKHYHNPRIHNLRDAYTLAKGGFTSLPDVWLENRDNTSQYMHPTQKPIALAIRGIRYHSKENDIVLDVFGGSGSTLIAAEQLGRTARLMELDPKYCDVIRKRWARFMYGNDAGWQSQTPALVGSGSDDTKT